MLIKLITSLRAIHLRSARTHRSVLSTTYWTRMETDQSAVKHHSIKLAEIFVEYYRHKYKRKTVTLLRKCSYPVSILVNSMQSRTDEFEPIAETNLGLQSE